MELRGYQQELIEEIRSRIKRGSKSICAVLPCGGGKSIIQAMIAKSATDKGNKVLFLVHRKELCDQIRATFKVCGVNLNLCQIAMVQTVTRRLTKTVAPQVIITDEAHHCLSKSYINIYDYFISAIRLGFTATPIRMNEGGLGKIFDDMVTSVSVKWLIENNYLSPYEYFSVKLVNTDNIHTKRGDYDAREVAELVENNYLYGETLKTYQKIAGGKKTIIYCATIEQSKNTIEEFKKVGISSAHIDGAIPAGERERLVNKFRNNEIQVISNVDLFGEGFDIPDCECVILLRPTKSLTLFIQQSMRSMRFKEGKTALVIDHVGNVYEHGLPDDEREWSLKTKRKKEKEVIKVKECPNCYKVVSTTVKTCKYCNYIFEKNVAERNEKEVLDMELTKITSEDILRAKPYSYVDTLDTFEDLVRFQQAKKYKFGWVIRQCIAKNISYPSKYNSMAKHMKGA